MRARPAALHYGSMYGLVLAATLLTFRLARAQDAVIPLDGLELWVKADGPTKVANNQVLEWTDMSGKGNNAVHDAFGQGIPVVATANGKPTMRFSGGYAGFHFTKISNIRTVFAVLSKDSTSCLPTLPNYGTPAKFWIGGNANPTYFHPEHGCSIYNGNLSEVSPNLVNGKTYLNGKLIDGRTTRFPFTLGLLSLVSLADVAADTIARDRNFQDRSWQGDISELLIYSRPLDDATRVRVQNALASKYALTVEGGPTFDSDSGSPAVMDASATADREGSTAGDAGGVNPSMPGVADAAGSGEASARGDGPGPEKASDASPVQTGPDANPGPTDSSAGCACVVARHDRNHVGGVALVASLTVGISLLRRTRRRRSNHSAAMSEM